VQGWVGACLGVPDAREQSLEQHDEVGRADIGAHRASLLGAAQQDVDRRVQPVLQRARDGDGVRQVAFGGCLLTDAGVVVTEITHHGWSHVTGTPYRFTALGVIRVRDGEIVCYDDYMDPIALARLLGRTGELAAALAGA
jgi:ketosteroid isomerase-like protein